VDVSRHTPEDGFERVVCSTEALSLTLIPELGAKVVSLVDRARGREWVAQPIRPYRSAAAGDAFADFDGGGWDECFPNVGAGPHPGSGVELQDHGEVWSAPWALELADGTVATTVRGTQLPFVLERRLALRGALVEARYSLENSGPEPLRCLWSMHPLLATEPETQIVLPDVATVYRDGDDAPLAWPTPPPAEGSGLKLFAGPLARGRAALLDETTAATWLALAFDTDYLGIWINAGVWPPDQPLHHAALEPASGRADRLDAALRLGETWLLTPGERLGWAVTLEVGAGRDALTEALA
jgi:hypothetical protein